MILFIFILFTATATPTCYPSSGHTKSSICTQTCPHMHTLMSPGMIKNDLHDLFFHDRNYCQSSKCWFVSSWLHWWIGVFTLCHLLLLLCC